MEYRQTALEARDEAIERVGANAPVGWKEQARVAVKAAMLRGEFTTDEVWEWLDAQGYQTRERRALGAVMKQMERDGEIRPTGQWRQSLRPECHARPVRVWRRA